MNVFVFACEVCLSTIGKQANDDVCEGEQQQDGHDQTHAVPQRRFHLLRALAQL